MAGKILCVSVDLDSLACYYGIWGLNPPQNGYDNTHYTKGLSRFIELFSELSIKSTLFAIGKDLLDPDSREVFKQAVKLNHEPGNHTLNHFYNMTKLSRYGMEKEILKAHEIISEVSGREPVGFRAPGYHLCNEIPVILTQSGYLYDASLLPSPPYYFVKAISIAFSGLKKRRSKSILGGMGMIFAPSGPYRMGKSYWRSGEGLLEMPCSVVTAFRFPFIGTILTIAPESVFSYFIRDAVKQDFLSLEFHAIDLMDARIDGFEDLLQFQPDAKIPLEKKIERIKKVLKELVINSGFQPMTLEQATSRLL